MTDYNAIPDEDLEPGKPWTSIKALRTRDNPIAIAEGAAGAPKVLSGALNDYPWGGEDIRNGSLGAEEFQTGTAERDWVLARTAGASAGAVGTYGFLRLSRNTTGLSPGATESGSLLDWTNASAETSTSPSGTWMLMGRADDNTDTERATLWLRIS